MDVEDLFKVYTYIKDTWGKHSYKYIDYCGIEPVMPAESLYYSCTPRNSVTFARTGAEGVHFSIVNDSNTTVSGPIIMTVPMAATTNIVVAETLNEFLSLGCFGGWSALEQISYNLEKVISYYSYNNFETSDTEDRFLSLIRSAFKLKSIPLSQHRLEQLEEKFFAQLQIDHI